MFRNVALPENILGKLYLHSMPGRYEKLSRSFQEIRSLSIDQILSLVSLEETEQKSPFYAEAIKSNDMPCEYVAYPITDAGIPDDHQDFALFVEDAARRLKDNKRLLIHCSGGIGRTGTMACCILIALGLSEDDAETIVRKAIARPETHEQRSFVHWYGQRKANRKSRVQQDSDRLAPNME
jgi:protein-tyrosine phosphatase